MIYVQLLHMQQISMQPTGIGELTARALVKYLYFQLLRVHLQTGRASSVEALGHHCAWDAQGYLDQVHASEHAVM